MSESGETDAKAGAGVADSVFRLIYRSHSKIPAAAIKEELGRILRVARTNNAASGVTGALMLYDAWFAQALEGPEDAVQAIFAKIKADPRHDTIEVRESSRVPSRVFSKWAMASVGEHGDPDTPLVPTAGGVSAGSAWRPTPDQEMVLTVLRDVTRGYGR